MSSYDGKIWYGLGIDNTQLQADANKSSRIFKGIGDTAVSEGKRIDTSLSNIAKTAGAVFSIAAVKSFGMQLIDITGKFQTFQAVLNNTLQSSSKAKESMMMIQDFAATTPFQVDALTGAFVKLANQGFVPTRTEMMKLGDLASSTGKGFDQLAEAIIDAQTGEFERLKEFGIRASKEGEKVTFTFKEQATQVDFTASTIRDYILSLGDLKGVAGANAEIAKTLSGQYSNLQDTITQTMNEIGQSSEDVLSGALSGASYLVEHYEELGKVLLSLIATYGVYKASVMAVSAVNQINNQSYVAAEILELQKLLPIKEASKNADIEEAAAKGCLSQISAERLISIRAEVNAELDKLKIKAKALAVGAEEATQDHKDALKRALKSKQAVLNAQQEMKMAEQSGNAERIRRAEVKLAVAEDERHIAVKARKVTADNMVIAKSKANSAAIAVDTMQTNINTAAVKSATTAKNLWAVATTRLTKAFHSLKVAFASNPVGLILTGITMVMSVMTLFRSKTEEATEELTGLDKALKNAGEEFDKETSKIKALQDVMNNSKVAYDERKRALNELKNIIPGYNAELSNEGVLINNNTEAIKAYLTQLERQIKLKSAQDELEEAYKQKRLLQKDYDAKSKDWSSKNTNSAYHEKPIIDVVGMFGGRDLQKAEKAKDEAKQKLNDIEKTINSLNSEIEQTSTSTSGAAATVRTYSEQLQDAATKVITLKGQLSDLKGGKGSEPDFAKAIENKQKELDEAQKAHDLLRGVNRKADTKSSKDLENAQKEYSQAYINQVKELYDAETALKRKQITDKIELIEFDRDVAIKAIEAEKQAYIELANTVGQKADTSIFDKEIELVKVSAGVDISKESKHQQEETAKALDELRKEFETFEQERTRIQVEYAAKRKKMFEEDGKTLKQGFTQGNVDEANTDEQEALNNLDLEIAKREIAFNQWIGKLVGLGLKELREALQTANTALNNGNSNLSEKEKAALRAKIVALEKQIEVEETKSSEQRAAEKSKKQWGDTIKVMNGVQETVGNIINSFDGLDTATKDALTAATNIAGGIIGMISGIQALAVTGAEAIKGVERASVILAIIGTAVQIITAIFNLAGAAEKRHQEALAEIHRNKVAMQREYNQLLFEQNLLLKEATSVFGIDEITKAINAFVQYRDQLTKYKEELKGAMPAMNFFERMTNDMLGSYNQRLNDYKNGIGALNDITIKTGHVKTGLFGWGKGRDIYTSISQVYDDLIDKEGKLNVERAKAILATQTMSDENKALLESLIKMQENAEKAMEELNSYLEGTFGDLGGGVMDAITDGITNGTDAWKEFGKTGASVLEKLGKQIAYELFFSEKFKGLQKQLTDIYGSGKTPEQVAKDARDAVANFYNGIGSDMQNAENWLKQWQDEAAKQGLDLWGAGKEEREASKRGIATASQESVDENNGRLTAIQGHTFLIQGHTSSIADNMKILADRSSQILTHLSGIESNTAYCRRLEAIDNNMGAMKSDITSMKNSLGSIEIKGLVLRK